MPARSLANLVLVNAASLSVLGWTACAAAPQAEFEADVSYDTVAEIGEPAPDNPLLVYEDIFYPKLVTERAAVFVDGRPGRIVMVDLLDGSGWEVDDGGGSGPGEFSGLHPWLGEADGLIFTASQRDQAATWSQEGELLSTTRYPEFRPPGVPGPVAGLLRSGIAVLYLQESADFSREGQQSTRQWLAAYSPVEGRLWEYELPPSIVEVDGNQASGDYLFMVDARLGTIAYVRARSRELVVLNADGSLRERAVLPYDAWTLRVDADERIWVHVDVKNQEGLSSHLVYDSDDLSVPPRRVAATGVEDARGSYLLTVSRDSLGIDHLHLLKERDGG